MIICGIKDEKNKNDIINTKLTQKIKTHNNLIILTISVYKRIQTSVST